MRKFSIRTLLLVVLMLCIILCCYGYFCASVDVEFELSYTRDSTVQAENIIFVENAEKFKPKKSITLRMPRWRAWRSDKNEKFYVIEGAPPLMAD